MILALVVLSVIILFHEFGHFLLAKLNGITVVEFSLGMGPRLLSHVSKKSGTRYSWKLLPFGGSCAMLGEFGDEETGGEPREAGREPGEAGSDSAFDMSGSFYAKSPLARMSVIAAGPIFNFILAFVFAVVIVSWAGYDPPEIEAVAEGQAAEAAGLKPGDVVTKIGNQRVMIARDMVLYMALHGKQDVVIQYKRLDGASGTWQKHETYLDADSLSYQNGRYMIGIQFSGYRSPAGTPFGLIKYGAAEVRYTVLSVIDSLKELVKGRVGADDIAGPIRIVTIIDDTVEQVSSYGIITVFMNLLNLMVMFSANLGVMNLLPFPALDGGRLIFLLWELITKRPVNQRIEEAVNMTGMALLMTFMIFVIFNDLRFVIFQ